MSAAPVPALVGEVVVPGDKSVTHRALLLGALAQGTTRVRGPLAAADTLSTASIVAQLGARVEGLAGPDAVAEWTITGSGELLSPQAVLDCGNAGTAARLLIGLLASRRGRWVLDGDASLRRRPMGRVTRLLAALGADVEGDVLPVTVRGAPLRGGEIVVEVPSAQVKSALMLAALGAEAPLTVIQHTPTRDHTEALLPRFGADVVVEPGRVTVSPGPLAAADVDVPGDPSSAAFLLAAALITPGSDVWVRHVGLWPRRTGFLRALERAGADVMVLARHATGSRRTDPIGDLRAGASALRAFDIAPEDVSDLVDEIPILALVAARAEGTSRFAGLAELRLKESDRIASVASLLQSLGVSVEADADELRIHGVGGNPGAVRAPPAAALQHDDHRLALTAAVACLAVGAELPCEVPSAAISFPGFVELVGALRR